MIIRTEQPKDFQAIRQLNEAAFKGSVEADLVENIRQSDYYQPGLSLVAEAEDGTVVGYIMFSEISLETENKSRFILGLAPLAVLPEFQKQRIGSRLMEEGIRLSREKAYPAIAVLGHADYYPRFGFSSSEAFNIPAPFDVPAEYYMLLELYDASLENLQGVIRYPETFSTKA
ncbi:N-acetyltransferase [Listeria seeligeri]|uniref:GNAT family N-acetyltransferase n=1 Tax=Listeria seeligeri TaxID=1640 RepID=UPI0016299338|nr:N-acetyltransferase [Listeria seeligeri]MBC1422764.1 N-acetyltransferase [Listeria seeligeri]MBC1539670.1 N-acetyltransferase [Listeria seeligeri]MBC1556854.1 N-acetyltransferase [Listeria seeligeri]MBC1752410.1 N-acetyltransferase [Listeria seeligeri]MBC1755062.1 N-acetyltransferase [Listeria seeligeri]